jgi:hypothetical protein
MEADLEDELKTYSFDNGKERSRGRGFCGSLREGIHEGKINESNEEENVGGNSFRRKDWWEWQGSECELVDDVGVFIVTKHVIACDPNEVVLDNQLGEDHVGLSILYCSNNVSTIMIIWKWPLFTPFWMGSL